MPRAKGRDGLSLNAVVRGVSDRLSAAGVPSPDHDAVALVALVLGEAPVEVRTAAARGDDVPEGWDDAPLEALVARRAAREPLQHLIGVAPFRGLEIAVGPGVFVPRPETEVVAGAAIEAARERAASGAVEVADLCSGTGAIGLAVAHEVSEARVVLVEVDDDAVSWLRRNVEASSAAGRVEVVHADVARALTGREGRFDVVVSNPPYVPTDGQPVEPEAAHDPVRALYGLGEDGLAVPRIVIDAAARLLKGGGILVVEHSDLQGEAMRDELLGSGEWEDVCTGRDLAGRERYALARRAPIVTDSACDRSGN